MKKIFLSIIRSLDMIWDRAGTLLGVQEHVPRNRNVLLDRNNRNTFLAFLKI